MDFDIILKPLQEQDIIKHQFYLAIIDVDEEVIVRLTVLLCRFLIPQCVKFECLVAGFGESIECYWFQKIVHNIQVETIQRVFFIRCYEYAHATLRDTLHELQASQPGHLYVEED